MKCLGVPTASLHYYVKLYHVFAWRREKFLSEVDEQRANRDSCLVCSYVCVCKEKKTLNIVLRKLKYLG